MTQSKTFRPTMTITLILVILIGAGLIWGTNNDSTKNTVSIGVITDLSGGAAYWGESTTIGANLAKEDLKKDGYNVDIKFEDYQLQAPQALSAATKLVAQDKVNGLYAEFNPATYSITPYLKDKNVLFMYDAAPVSPLKESDHYFKTYLDYEVGCRKVAEKFMSDGISKIGSLKVNLEFGDLCDKGIRSVYGNNVVTETYNLGDTDFKTQIQKMNQQGVKAIINTGFEGDTLNTLKVIKEQNLLIKYGTVDDTVTPQVTTLYSNVMKGGYGFGFQDVEQSFRDRVKAANGGKEPATYYPAALAYTHIQQMAKALASCGSDTVCSSKQVANSSSDSTIGFKKFSNQISDLDTPVKAY